MPHIVSGGGFVTKLTITNLISGPNKVVVNYVSQSGSLISSTQYALGSGATVRISTPESDRFSAGTTSWGIVGSDFPVGVNVFFELNGGGGSTNIVNTIGFNDAPPLLKFTVPVELQPGTSVFHTVGLALANPTSQSATISMALVDGNGTQLAVSTVPLNPYSQIPIDLSTVSSFRAALSSADFIGTLRVSSTVPVSSLALGDDSGPFFSTPPIAAGRAGQLVIPHIISGGGFVTKLTLIDMSGSAQNLRIQYFDPNGNALSQQQVALKANGAVQISTPEADRYAASTTQWAIVTAPGPAAVNLFFEFEDSAHKVLNTIGFNDVAPGTDFTIPVEFQPDAGSGGRTVGLALSNPNTTVASVKLTLIDQTTQVIGSTTVSLNPNSQTAIDLVHNTALAGGLPSGDFVGVLTVSSSLPVSAIALGDDFGPFYSTPVIAGRAAAVPYGVLQVEQGPAEVVFRTTNYGCTPSDAPDTPARAVRLGDGTLLFDAGNSLDYFMSFGPDFNSLRRDCSHEYKSIRSKQASTFTNLEWLTTVYRVGTTIYSLVHNEFHDAVATNCDPGVDLPLVNPCWYNSITSAISTDGGRTFSHPNPFLVAPAYRQWDAGALGGAPPLYGYFEPSNIVAAPDGFYYAMTAGIDEAGQQGTCLIRTQDLADASSWRAWDGSSFALQLTNPYTGPAPNLCAFVDRQHIQSLHESLTYNALLHKYMLVGAAASPTCGFYFSTSSDLIHWTPLQLLMPAYLTVPPSCTPPAGRFVGSAAYPSIIDHNDASVNFETPGASPYLYHTIFNEVTPGFDDRYLMRVPLTFTQLNTPHAASGVTPFLESSSGGHTTGVQIDPAHGAYINAIRLDGNDIATAVNLSMFDGSQGSQGWNPVLSGDEYGHPSPILAQTIGPDFLYVETQPLHWIPDNKGGGSTVPVPSDVYVEQTISAVAGVQSAFRVHYKITHFGTDTHYNSGDVVPSVNITRGHDTFITYAGNAAWTNDGVAKSTLPGLPGLNNVYASEQWAALVDASDNGLTLYIPGQYPYESASLITPADSNSPYNYVHPFAPLTVGPGAIIELDAYLFVGDYKAARQAIYALHQQLAAQDAFAPWGALDVPQPNATLTGAVQVSGWAIDNTAVARIDVLIDGSAVGQATYGTSRPDIPNAYANAIANAGYTFSLDTTKISNGAHTVVVRVTDKSGNTALLQPVPITIKN